MLDTITKDKILELNKSNKSLREIANELGVGKTTVASVIKNYKPSPVSPVNPVNEESPKIIITETNIDKMDTSQFLNSLSGPSSAPAVKFDPVDKNEQASFLKSFVSELDIDLAPKKKGRPAKAQSSDFLNELMAEPVKPSKTKGLSKAKAHTSFAQPQAQEVIETKPILEKGELIVRITLNVNTFPDVLRDYIKPNRDAFLEGLGKKSHTELSSLLSTMDYSRSIHNTASVMKSITLTGASILEMGTKRFLKMRTDGFAALLAQASELNSILSEIAMENKDNIISRYQSPTVRLTTLIVTSLLAVDARNRMNGPIQTPNFQPTEQPQAEQQQFEPGDKYNDL